MPDKNGIHCAHLKQEPDPILRRKIIGLTPGLNRDPLDRHRPGNAPDFAHTHTDQVFNPLPVVLQLMPAAPRPTQPGMGENPLFEQELPDLGTFPVTDKSTPVQFPFQGADQFPTATSFCCIRSSPTRPAAEIARKTSTG